MPMEVMPGGKTKIFTGKFPENAYLLTKDEFDEIVRGDEEYEAAHAAAANAPKE